MKANHGHPLLTGEHPDHTKVPVAAADITTDPPCGRVTSQEVITPMIRAYLHSSVARSHQRHPLSACLQSNQVCITHLRDTVNVASPLRAAPPVQQRLYKFEKISTQLLAGHLSSLPALRAAADKQQRSSQQGQMTVMQTATQKAMHKLEHLIHTHKYLIQSSQVYTASEGWHMHA